MLTCGTCGGQTILVEEWDQTQCERSVELATRCPQCDAVPRAHPHVRLPAGQGRMTKPEGSQADSRLADGPDRGRQRPT